MLHSTFKHRPTYLDAGVSKCPCGQTFNYNSGKDLEMKIQMHKKFCDKLSGQPREASQPGKTMTQEEYECMNAKRREFHR